MRLLRRLTPLIGLFLLAGCGTVFQGEVIPSADPLGLLALPPDEPAAILVLVPEEPEYSQMRAEIITTVEMAVNSGTLSEDLLVTVEVAEASCDASEADIQQVISSYENVAGVIGPLCEETCATASLALTDMGLTAISPSCQAVSLTDPLLHSAGFMRTIYSNNQSSQIAAQFAFDELGARRAITLADNSLNAQTAADVFSTHWQDDGGLLVDSVIWDESTPASTLVEAISSATPNVVFAYLDPPRLVEFIREYSATGANDLYRLIVSGNVQTDWVTNRLGGVLLSNIYTLGPYVNTPTYNAFIQRFSNTNGYTPSQYAASSYDATLLLLDAIDQSMIRRADGSFVMGRTTLQDHLYQTAGFEGVTGTITCTAWGDCGNPSIGVFRYADNGWEITYVP